jgi:hypothetical protein
MRREESELFAVKINVVKDFKVELVVSRMPQPVNATKDSENRQDRMGDNITGLSSIIKISRFLSLFSNQDCHFDDKSERD